MKNSNSTLKEFTNIINEIFIDRNDEIQIIKSEYANVLEGNMGLVAVTGRAGIGKTHLIKHVAAQFGQNTFVYGKSAQNQGSVFTSVSEVINQITDHLLTLSPDILENVRQDLNKKISDDMALLALISPKIINLIHTKQVFGTNDFQRLKYRVRNAIYKFIDIASKYLFPLVIYIDDVQWADSLSLEIMKTLVGKKQGLNVLLAFSYRDNETNANMQSLIHVLQNKVSLFVLTPLDFDAVMEYMYSAFGERINNANRLASLLLGLTLGNPFYLKETILILMQENIIKYSEDKKSWSVRINRMNNFFLNDDVEEVIKNRIVEENNELLAVIACCDGKIEERILKLLVKKDEEELSFMLNRLVDCAIIVKQEEDKRTFYLFTHDIIYKIVLGNLTFEQKQRMHYRIADSLFTDSIANLEIKSLVAVHLLNASKENIYKNSSQWLMFLFDIGLIEKQRASIDTALSIFELCKDVLTYETPTQDGFYLDLHLELAECLNLCGRQDESQEIISSLASIYKNRESQLAINRKQMYLYYYQREHKKTLQTGVLILKDLKFGFGRHRLPIDLIISRIVYSNKRIRSLSEVSDAVDGKASIILETLSLMNACAAVSEDKLTAAIGLSAALTSVKCGESANSLVGYVSYAYILYIVWNDLPKAKLIVEQILKMADRISDPSNKSMVFFMIGAFLSHWSMPVEKADYYLQKGIQYGEQSGDFLFLGHCITTSLDTKAVMGYSFENTMNYIEDCRKKYFETEQYTTTYNLEAHEVHLTALKYDGEDDELSKIGSKYPKLTPFEKLTENTLQMERFLLTGRLVEGFKIVKMIEGDIKATKGLICRLSIVFYSLLIRIGISCQLDRKEQQKNEYKIKQMLNELAYYAKLNEENFKAYYLLAKAEHQTNLKGNMNNLYNLAAQHALSIENHKIAALANLLAAKKYNNCENISKFYASESVRLYKLWGADYIAELIENQYELAQEMNRKMQLSQGIKEERHSLLRAFMKDSEGKNEDETINLLIEKIIEAGVTDYCCVITKESNQLYMKHQMSADGIKKSLSEKINIGNLSRLPHKVIRYTSRTGKDLIISECGSKSVFDTDSYLAKNPDVFIACLPIVNCGVLVGLIYLENRLEPFRDETIFEIKSILPLLAVSFRGINGVVIKDMFKLKKQQTLLTRREMEILKLIKMGFSNESICSELVLSIGSVKKHVSSILTKLGAKNRIQAIIKAKEKKIL